MGLTRLSIKQFKEIGKSQPPRSVLISKGIAAIVQKADAADDNVRRFVLSSESVDRDNDTINQDGWTLEPFRKSGTFLWAHDSRMPPIGNPFACEVRTLPDIGRALVIDVRFPAADMPHPLGMGFGNTVKRMYDEKLLKAVSAGFLPLEYSVDETRAGMMPMNFAKCELVEGSAVPVPSNRDCVQMARAKGIDVGSIIAWAEHARDDASIVLPDGYAEALVQLLDSSVGAKTISIPAPAAGGIAAGPAETPAGAVDDRAAASGGAGAGVDAPAGAVVHIPDADDRIASLARSIEQLHTAVTALAGRINAPATEPSATGGTAPSDAAPGGAVARAVTDDGDEVLLWLDDDGAGEAASDGVFLDVDPAELRADLERLVNERLIQPLTGRLP